MRGWRLRTWVHRVAGAAALGGVVASCGGDPAETGAGFPPDRWPAEELAPATPLRVGWVPDGYTLDTAEEGDVQPSLFSDSDYAGTIEPDLLLAPSG